MLNYSKIKAVLTSLMLCSALNCHAVAQGAKTSEPILVNGDSNEDLKALLDLLAQTAGTDKLIIMVGRLGSKESLSIISTGVG